MAWKPGPLPPNTYQWGGVVPSDLVVPGFFFASFCGDHVEMQNTNGVRTLMPHEVRWYDNSLQLPPFKSQDKKEE